MITKQQAIEFIDELSKNHKIFMDLEHGKFYVNTYITIDEDILGDYGFEKGGFLPLEIAVWLFIKENINTDLVKEFTKIPVDVDMLEAGQTYKVHIQEDWEHRFFTAKFLGFDEDDVVKFENNRPCTIFDFREIYKVNEHANM